MTHHCPPGDNLLDDNYKSALAAALGATHTPSSHARQTTSPNKHDAAHEDATQPHINTVCYEIIATIAGIPHNELSSTQQLGNDLGIDSLSLLELSIRLEERLGIVIPDNTIEPAHTITEIIDLLTQAHTDKHWPAGSKDHPMNPPENTQ